MILQLPGYFDLTLQGAHGFDVQNDQVFKTCKTI